MYYYLMFTVISENLQPFEKKAKEAFAQNKAALISFLHEIENRGAQYIDVNLGPVKREKEKTVSFFIKTIEENSRLNILIDSTDSEVIEIAMEVALKKPIINGFSMEERKLKTVLPLAKRFKCKIVGLVMSDGYIPSTLDDKILLAEQMLSAAESDGISREQIIIDPIIAPLGWGDGVIHNNANIEFLRIAKEVFGENVRTLCGLSNLTTSSARGSNKGLLQSYFLSMLYGAGLDMIMLDIFNTELLKTLKFIKTLDDKGVFSFSDFVS